MKELIYYPNFESQNADWLKFALVYLDSFSPIMPETGDKTLSKLYVKLKNETDLLKIHRPKFNEGNRATKRAIDFVLQVMKNPNLYAEELNLPNADRHWKNPANQNYTLYVEKYVGNWAYFCLEHKLANVSDSGLLLSRSLGEIYMTFLAQEVAYENEASPITDKPELDELSIFIKSKNINQDHKILVAKSIIEKQLPLNFENLSIDKVIEIRNKNDFKLKQKAFHNELDNLYESLGKAIEPSKFIKSYDETIKDWAKELSSYGIQLAAASLSAYILIQDNDATNPEYVKEILEGGLILLGGREIAKNINKDSDRKYCRQYLSDLKNIQ